MNILNIKASLGGINTNSCIFNASGPRWTNINELVDIDNSISALVLSKSATLESREGNPSPR